MKRGKRKSKAKYCRRRRAARYNVRHGGELRGNSEDRRRRKLWLLKTFGDGKTVNCTHCRKKLNYETVTADRIIPGCRGGRYTRDNLQPSCLKCNNERHINECRIDSGGEYIESAAAEAKRRAREEKAMSKFMAGKPSDFGSAASNPRLRYKKVKRGRRGILRGERKFSWRRSA